MVRYTEFRRLLDGWMDPTECGITGKMDATNNDCEQVGHAALGPRNGHGRWKSCRPAHSVIIGNVKSC